ncbi:nicotinamide-nucleotide adenylyltransferase, NadR type [Flavobacterium gillisiae]|uniref:Nicotinamide-nucleotide adenylyltransferase, NadR type n=2 Tax=Flavobacterium gillisiae TaxID=150146 RepID=A0A1H3WJR9_9FLAO|nr:nicotinamide-nucleotide adenylyltransferase, NadR type [Flavobacterium gillisiae]
MFGPESTGKTTLAIQLADHYKTAWVPEFARDYLQKKWDMQQQICDVDDMLPIAYGQTKLENDGQAVADTYLFCDTNLMVTKVFSEVYYNYCDPALDKAAQEHEYDLFFLTDIDVPWEKDDLRDRAEGRDAVFGLFKKSLIENNKPFITLSGDKNLRLEKAISIIDDLTKVKEMGLSSLDFVQIYQHGIPVENIKRQLAIFKNGIPKMQLISAATFNNGIVKFSEKEFSEKAAFFDKEKSKFKLLKFVPASGAASRMFKFLSVFLSDFKIGAETINAYINRKKDTDLAVFIVGMNKFAFFKTVDEQLKKVYPNFDSLDRDYKNYCFIKMLLDPQYFDFANKPKGILPFHKYYANIASPIEEHLYECGYYASSNGKSNLHFTVSKEHQSDFQKIIKKTLERVETETKNSVDISYSYQKQSTDTIAVEETNAVFRNNKGDLVFRPGGHGALIENLNALDADIIFIKNIDNVILHNNDAIALYKKGLAGVLLEVQNQVFDYLNVIDSSKIDANKVDEIAAFLEDKLNVKLPEKFGSFTFENQITAIKNTLNRPIRVCGMVKNEGEAGGGPFWVKDENNKVSLQIVETSQIDLNNSNQSSILNSATHFNPVDLVCGIKNYKNEKFDLTKFINNNSGFLVKKTTSGINIRGYELPGLWNGAMANWLTIFIEVPLLTFNPVKTVNDLLKNAHQE